MKIKNSTKGKLEAKSELTDSALLIHLPIRTVSEANTFEHWRVKHARHRSQQLAVSCALKLKQKYLKLPCKILFTRFAPTKLDAHDNLPMSFKYIVDTTCAVITNNYIAGQADSDPRITISYNQIVSKQYGIGIYIYSDTQGPLCSLPSENDSSSNPY